MISNARRHADLVSFPVPIRLKRAVASVSPLAVTMLLTAAIFLLPATGEHRSARASAAVVSVSSTAVDMNHGEQIGPVRR